MDDADVIRRYRQAIFDGDYEAALALLDPDLAFYPPQEGLVLGRDDLRRIWSASREEYEHLTSALEPGLLEALPDGRLLTTTREIMCWRESGDHAATVERANLWRVENGKIVEGRVYENLDAARAAAATPA